jgi:hypothetical protein
VHPLGLALEGAEEAVPDDQDATVVAVEVDLVGAVVDTVVRGGVENELQRRRQLLHPLGVDPELVDETDRLLGEDHPGREAEQRQRRPERQRGHRRPGLAQRRREVVVLGGVVDDVARPEDAHLVVDAVEPVVGKVVGEEEKRVGPPHVRRHPQRRQLVEAGVDGDDDQLPDGVDGDVAAAHRQAGAGVPRLVADQLLVPRVLEREQLDHEQQHERRDRVEDQLRHAANLTGELSER